MLANMLRVLVVLVVLLVPLTASAEPDRARTQAAMEDYFAGEQRGGYVLLGMGLGGMVAGGLLYRSSNATAKGASYPLLGVGLLHAAAGVYIKLASANRVDDYTDQIAKDPQAFVTAERARMSGVSTQLTALKVVEVVLIAGGLTMAGIGHRTDRPRLKGAGLALAFEASLTLGFDIFAARRAHTYRDQLAAVDVQASLSPADRPALLVIHTGTF
jgi:hypothetical protein